MLGFKVYDVSEVIKASFPQGISLFEGILRYWGIRKIIVSDQLQQKKSSTHGSRNKTDNKNGRRFVIKRLSAKALVKKFGWFSANNKNLTFLKVFCETEQCLNQARFFDERFLLSLKLSGLGGWCDAGKSGFCANRKWLLNAMMSKSQLEAFHGFMKCSMSDLLTQCSDSDRLIMARQNQVVLSELACHFYPSSQDGCYEFFNVCRDYLVSGEGGDYVVSSRRRSLGQIELALPEIPKRLMEPPFEKTLAAFTRTYSNALDTVVQPFESPSEAEGMTGLSDAEKIPFDRSSPYHCCLLIVAQLQAFYASMGQQFMVDNQEVMSGLAEIEEESRRLNACLIQVDRNLRLMCRRVMKNVWPEYGRDRGKHPVLVEKGCGRVRVNLAGFQPGEEDSDSSAIEFVDDLFKAKQ